MSDDFDTALAAASEQGGDDFDAALAKHAVHAEPVDPSAGGGYLMVGPWNTGVQTPQWVDRTLSGAGKVGVDLARGAGQWLGLESREDVKKSRELDKPLMDTTAGKVGSLVGGLGFTAPAMLIPGVNTVAGAASVGAGLGALQPSESAKETATNIGAGGVLGAAGNLVGKAVSAGAKKLLSLARPESATNEAVAAAHDLGYVVPPATSNPTILNRALEGAAGKLSTAQAAAVHNQQITDNLVASEFGLPQGTPITSEVLDAVRSHAGEAYKAIRGLGDIEFGPAYEKELRGLTVGANKVTKALPNLRLTGSQEVKDLVESLIPKGGKLDGDTALELSKTLRAEGSSYLTSASRTGNPQDRTLGNAYRGAAEAVENAIQEHLNKIGQPEMAEAWDSARKTIAKTYDVERAIDGAGHVDARKLGKMLLKGRPLSENLEKAANFANAFPKAARNLSGESMPGMSPLDVYGGAALEAVSGNPAALAIGPARMATRSLLLSGPGQKLAEPGAISSAMQETAGRIGQSVPSLPQRTALGVIPGAAPDFWDLVSSKDGSHP